MTKPSQADDPLKPPPPSVTVRQQFTNVDTRPVKELNTIITLDDLRKQRLLTSHDAPATSPYVAKQKIRLPKLLSDSTEDESPASSPTARRKETWTPLAAARQQLQGDKEMPGLLERLDKSVLQCKIARDNRSYRLNSLGVFKSSINEARAHSMFRVEMHKELSTTSMRLPHTGKEVKPAQAEDSVPLRLERMYQRVLKSISAEEQARGLQPQPTRTMRDFRRHVGMGHIRVTDHGQGTGTSQGPHTLERSPSYRTSLDSPGWGALPPMSPGGGSLDPFSPGPASSSSRKPAASPAHRGSAKGRGQHSTYRISHASSVPFNRLVLKDEGVQRDGGGTASTPGSRSGRPPHSPGANSQGLGPGKAASARLDWSKIQLPPEVVEAQMAHLAAATEAHILRYHDTVARSQEELLLAEGLQLGTLELSPEELDRMLGLETMQQRQASQQLLELQGGKELKASSLELMRAAELPDLIKAALDHVGDMTKEFAEFKKSLPAPTSPAKKERKKISIPMHKRKEQQAAAAAAAAAAAGAGGALTPEDSSVSPHHHQHHHHHQSHPSPHSPGSMASPSHPPDSARSRRPSQADSASSPRGPLLSARRRASSRLGGGASYTTEFEEGEGEQDDLSSDPGGGARTSVWDGSEAGSEGGEDHRGSSQNASGASSRPLSPDAGPGVGAGGHSEGGDGSGLAVGQPPLSAQAQQPTRQLIQAFGRQSFHSMLEEAGRQPLHVQALPVLPAAPSASLYIQARLERVWALLHMPQLQRLDMVLRFTKVDAAAQLEPSLELWERAVAGVLQRETLLRELLLVQERVELGEMDRLSLATVERQCVALVQITHHVAELAAQLRDLYGGQLTLAGEDYPGEASVTMEHLVVFMEQLREYQGQQQSHGGQNQG